MSYKLVFHVHFQGHNPEIKNPTIKEVIDFFSGYDIIVLTVHLLDVTKGFYESFVKQCEKHSNKNKLIIPCLEDESRRHHFLLVGSRLYTQELVSQDGKYLTILAHPWGFGYHGRKVKKETHYLDQINGIEVWNLLHNSKKYPSLKTLNFFKKTHPKIKAYVGLDEHPPFKKYDVTTFVHSKDLKKESVIEALKQGRFYHRIGGYTITSQGRIKKENKILDYPTKLRCFAHEQSIHALSFSVATIKRSFKKLGIKTLGKNKMERIIKLLRRNL